MPANKMNGQQRVAPPRILPPMESSASRAPIAPRRENQKSETPRWFKALVLIVLMIGFLAAIYMLSTTFGADPNSTYVTNLFVDINGDGWVDYIKSAEIIINDGTMVVP